MRMHLAPLQHRYFVLHNTIQNNKYLQKALNEKKIYADRDNAIFQSGGFIQH